MSTPLVLASSRACGLALTLNPMIIALEADARVMSDSLIPPTAPCNILTATVSFQYLVYDFATVGSSTTTVTTS